MLKPKQADASADYDALLGFCLVAFRFDLMSEDLLPLLYQALKSVTFCWSHSVKFLMMRRFLFGELSVN